VTTNRRTALRGLPQIDALLRRADLRRAAPGLGPAALRALLRDSVADLRRGVLSGRLAEADLRARLEALPDEVRGRVAALSGSGLKPVINATGVIIHTNLGRAPLPPGALRRAREVAESYATLEYDLTRGARGSRGDHLAAPAARLFPGQALHAVNNAAAGMLLVLNTLARGREVLISRGELIEIGGSFRIPDILARSGAVLREVGTTNRTRTSDYRDAAGPQAGLILKVHTSNYRIVGFTSEAPLPELAALASERGIPLVVDQGSGNLLDVTGLGIPDEPTVAELLGAGADLVVFSGDKLLGGPQAGLIVGAPALVKQCRENHLTRALRLDKTGVAILEWVLQAHAAGSAADTLPAIRMLHASPKALARRASALAARLRKALGSAAKVSVLPGASRVGGGAAPLIELPTTLVAVEAAGASASTLEERLRLGTPPVIARVAEDRLLLDPRTILPGQETPLVRAAAAAAGTTR